jgi:aryl-alcohol dehydrogenase-like predicted oxidoreductase
MSYSPVGGGWLSGKYRKGSTKVLEQNSRMTGAEQHLTSPEGLRRLEAIERLIGVAEAKGTTLSRFALAWVRAQPGITTPIIGPRTEEQLDDNLAALGITITDDDRAQVDSIVPPGTNLL